MAQEVLEQSRAICDDMKHFARNIVKLITLNLESSWSVSDIDLAKNSGFGREEYSGSCDFINLGAYSGGDVKSGGHSNDQLSVVLL